MLSEQQRKTRSVIASASRALKKDPSDGRARSALENATREFRARSLEEHVRQVVDSAPPLTDEQCDRIATLLRSGR